jgi:flagellar hook-associated protein 3 FlgL
VFVESDETTASNIVAAINGDPVVGTLFTARLDMRDSSSAMTYGDGLVNLAATATTAGGSGIEFDQASGLVIHNGGEDHTVDVSTAETIEDLLNALNGSTAGVLAAISDDGRTLDVRSRISGADFSIGENGGSTATELGLRSFTALTQLSELNYGRGIRVGDGVDFLIQRGDGVDLAVDLGAAQTVGDVLAAINGHPLNPPGPGQVVARLALIGNGIELVEDPPGGVRPLAVRDPNLARTAEDLGLVPPGAIVSDPPATVGTASVIASGELRPLETAGVFHTLFRLTEALEANDLREIERTVGMLDDDIDRVNLARGDVGGRQQVLDALTDRVEVETIELKSALSQEIDVDLAQAISDLVGRQAALEASLRLAAQTLQMSLLDFL